MEKSRSDYSQEDYGRSWSSQEWKSGAAEHVRSGKPETTSWDILQKVDPHSDEPLLGGNAHSARYGQTIHDRTAKPVSVNHQEHAYSENFVMGTDAAEFVNKVKDQVRNRPKEADSKTFVMDSDAAEFVNKAKDLVRNRQKRMSNVAESGEEHSIWGMFMATTLYAATFMGMNFSTIQSVVKNHEDLTLKQMFHVTEQLVNNQDEINGLDKIQ